MKSGMLAAEAAVAALAAAPEGATPDMSSYQDLFDQSWVREELHQARNMRPAVALGGAVGGMLQAMVSTVLKGNEPWTLSHRCVDHEVFCPCVDHDVR